MSILQGFDWSIIQNAGWLAILQAVIFLILIVAIGITYRRVSGLVHEVQRISEEMKDLAAVEQKRAIREWRLVTQSAKTQKSVAWSPKQTDDPSTPERNLSRRRHSCARPYAVGVEKVCRCRPSM